MAALSETLICNLALSRIGDKRINAPNDGSPQAQQCTTHYAQARDVLLQSHVWRFAKARKSLAAEAVAPDFGYSYQFILPTACLRVIGLDDDTSVYVLEGDRLLTDDAAADLHYIKGVTDPTKFPPLFVEVLVLDLAMRLCAGRTQDKNLYQELYIEKQNLLRTVRAIDLQEQNTATEAQADTWNTARLTGTT
jgi:hypothetical protein